MKRIEAIKAFREFADYLDTHDFGDTDIMFSNVLIRCDTPEEFKEKVRVMGAFKKDADDGYYNAYRHFGDIKFEVFIVRDLVCKKIEKGIRVIPAQPEQIIPAVPERTEPMYEYECPDTILGLETKAEEVGV